MEYKALPTEFNFETKDDRYNGRVFTGYASTFDLDLGGDIIMPGAFKKTLAERADRVKILWEHKNPIGKPLRMLEDDKGLYVEGKISKIPLGDDALTLMKDKVVDEMSIGFSIPAGKSERDSNGNRIIREVKLFEFSPVTFGMNDNTAIQSVKSAKNLIATGKLSSSDIKELSELLTDIKALLTTEPPESTQPVTQPSELQQLMNAVNNFGA